MANKGCLIDQGMIVNNEEEVEGTQFLNRLGDSFKDRFSQIKSQHRQTSTVEEEWLTSRYVFSFPHGPPGMGIITEHRMDSIQKKALMAEMCYLRVGDDLTAIASWNRWGAKDAWSGNQYSSCRFWLIGSNSQIRCDVPFGMTRGRTKPPSSHAPVELKAEQQLDVIIVGSGRGNI